VTDSSSSLAAPSRRAARTAAWLCFGLIALGAVLRLCLALDGRIGYDALGYDYVLYERLATHVAAGDGLVLEPGGPPTFLRPPGYPVFLAALHALTGPQPLGVQVVQILLWSALMVLSALLSRPFGRSAVVCALAVLFFDPFWILLPLTGLSETLATTLLLAALALAVRAERGGSPARWHAGVGVLLGLAALTRINLAIAAPALALGLLRGRGGVRSAAVLCAAFGLTFSPWLVRNLAHGYAGLSTVSGMNAAAMAAHHGLLTGEELNAALGPGFDLRAFVPDLADLEGPGVASLLWEPFQNGRYMASTGLGEIEIDRRFAAAAGEARAENPGRLALAYVRNVWHFASSFFERDAGLAGQVYHGVSALLLLLAGIGVAAHARERAVLVWGAAAVTLVYYRYRLPTAPLIGLLAALGAQALLERARQLSAARRLRPLPATPVPAGAEPTAAVLRAEVRAPDAPRTTRAASD
jgi:4-amino-4-deoxy-L-arabinose transferase-like glycosyltransferase